MANAELLTNLSDGKESHNGKVHPDLVLVAVRELDCNVSVDRNKLKLCVSHDSIGVE